jgi:hypothetical protein
VHDSTTALHDSTTALHDSTTALHDSTTALHDAHHHACKHKAKIGMLKFFHELRPPSDTGARVPVSGDLHVLSDYPVRTTQQQQPTMASNTVSLTMKPQNGSIEPSRTALLIIDMQVSGARQHQ